MATTPLMSLVLPTPGVGGTAGPTWATDLNTALELVDSHDHSTGKGSKVKTAGLSIDADLDFGNFDPKNMRALWLNNNTASLAGSLTNRLYAAAGELYFNDNAGNVVQLTSSGSINVASLGTITGDYSTSTADLTYSNTTKTYTFLQSAGITGDINCGAVSFNENSAGVNSAKIKSPSSLAASYTATLWTALPGSKLPTHMDASGNLTNEQIVAAGIATDAVETAKIKDLNVTTGKLAANAVTTAKIADANVTRAKLEAVGQQISSAGSTTTSSTSYVAVTNLSVTLTTSGRPVYLTLIDDGTTGPSGIVANASSTTNVIVYLQFKRDTTSLGEMAIEHKDGANGQYIRIPPASMATLDTPGAGTYTYTVEIKVSTASGSGTVNACRLAAWEL